MVYFRYIIVNNPHKGDKKSNNNNNNNNTGNFILLSGQGATRTYRLTRGKYAYTPNFIKKIQALQTTKGSRFHSVFVVG
jgi:hypothetical protein